MLSARSHERELLDDPGVSEQDIRVSLDDIARMNRWLGGSAALRAVLLPRLRQFNGQTARLLDAGCGGGGTSRWVEERAPARGAWRIVGVDSAVRHLRIAAADSRPVAAGDLAQLPFRSGAFDFAFSTLTLHHLSPDELVRALRELRRVTTQAVVLNDIVRSPAALLAFRAVSPLFARNSVTRDDGIASIRRAYTTKELRRLAADAGCRDARVLRHPLYFRMTLVCSGGGR